MLEIIKYMYILDILNVARSLLSLVNIYSNLKTVQARSQIWIKSPPYWKTQGRGNDSRLDYENTINIC